MFLRIYQSNKRMAFILLTILCSISLVLVGCGNADTTDPETNQDDTSTETRTIQHAMDETKVPVHPEKVVILTNEGTEALLAMGVKPVGAVRSWTGDPWYEHIAVEMDGITDVGTESQVNLETIASLEPDLIIGNKQRQAEVYEQLSNIAPTVFAEELRGDWKDNFQLYAEALNKVAEGEQVLAEFDQRISQFREKAEEEGLLSTEISVVRFLAGNARIYYKDTFSGVIFEQIGLARPEAQNKDEFAEEVTTERIPEMEGDILFYFTYDTGDGEASQTEKEWVSNALWKNLNVVQNNKAFRVDDAIWNTAGGVIAANLLLDDLNRFFFESE